VVFPAGEYEIGSVSDELDRSKKNEARHSVELTRPFASLDREITMEELIARQLVYADYRREFDAKLTDGGFATDWYDSVAFCRWLGNQSGFAEVDQCYADPESLDKESYSREPNPDANWAPRNWPLQLGLPGFRLPTESEWEVASRCGGRTSYGFGSDVNLLDRFGWFGSNSDKRVHPPRQLRPSLRGLFDMHGNLFEWTHDWFRDYEKTAVVDPMISNSGTGRVDRGGSWSGGASNCRSAFRHSGVPTFRSVNYGFRLALSLTVKHAEAGERDK
jgi:formylglycine-generating enzyme required for sulfatase activity